MREVIEGSQIIDSLLRSGVKWGTMTQALTGNVTLLEKGPMVYFFDPNASDRVITLPTTVRGFNTKVIHNGTANLLTVQDASSNTVAILSSKQSVQIFMDGTTVKAEVSTTMDQLPSAKYTKNTTAGATTAAAGDLTGAAYTQAEYSAVGAANLTTRTAAQMIADANLQVGDSYVLEITNTSGGTTTLVAGTGVTLTGTMTMATNTTRRFNVKVTGAATITIQSTGVGTIS